MQVHPLNSKGEPMMATVFHVDDVQDMRSEYAKEFNSELGPYSSPSSATIRDEFILGDSDVHEQQFFTVVPGARDSILRPLADSVNIYIYGFLM